MSGERSAGRPHSPHASSDIQMSASPTATASPTASRAPTSPTLSQTTLVDDSMSETTAASHDGNSASAISPSTSGLSMLEMLGIGSPTGASTAQHSSQQGGHHAPRSPQHTSHGAAGHSHAGHDGTGCHGCGGEHHDLEMMPRTFADKVLFDWAIIMDVTHPKDYTVSLCGNSVPSSNFATPGSSNQSRAERFHQQTASRTPSQTKDALRAMRRTVSYGEDQLDGTDWMLGRVNNVYHKLPIVTSNGKSIFAAIPADFLPHRPRENSIGRPAIFSKRLWRFSRAFWADYFPSCEATAAITQIEASTKQHDISGAAREESLPCCQVPPSSPIYVPASFSGFEWPCLYDEGTGLCWPLINISKQKEKGAPFLPWQNKRKGTKYFAFAPCPVDPFNHGPPPNPLVVRLQGQHPVRVERLIAIRREKAATFVSRLEKIDEALVERMVKVGIGQVTLASKDKVAGCVDCYKPFGPNDHIIAIPCGGYHVAHPRCLEDHFDQHDLIRHWTCPSCDTIVQENNGCDETGTLWFVPRPKPVRTLREEVARRENGGRRWDA